VSPRATAKQKRDARAIVRARDGHRCQMCGASILNIPSSLHHRVNRGMGGSANLERPSLLIRLCGTGTTGCHGFITEHPRLAGELGWLLPKLNADLDPTQEPIYTFAGWRLLDDGGNSTGCDAPSGAVVWHDGTAS
jgi:hypothetical protein